MSIQPGTLYVVATPIGNLQDLSPRAVAVLRSVTRIAAEDTRHSRTLLQQFAIATSCVALHEHNEAAAAERLLDDLQAGATLALISDAGTPLVSDPGFRLVLRAHERGIRVAPIPGPSAVIAALSAAGLPSDRFAFEGFLPSRAAARRARLRALAVDPRTLVFYEAPHRIVDMLSDLAEIFGAERPAVLARELTKTFETLRHASLRELLDWVTGDDNQRKGEIVVLVHGAPERAADLIDAAEPVLAILLEELPVKQAAALAARITGASRNAVYQRALELARHKTR